MTTWMKPPTGPAPSDLARDNGFVELAANLRDVQDRASGVPALYVAPPPPPQQEVVDSFAAVQLAAEVEAVAS